MVKIKRHGQTSIDCASKGNGMMYRDVANRGRATLETTDIKHQSPPKKSSKPDLWNRREIQNKDLDEVHDDYITERVALDRSSHADKRSTRHPRRTETDCSVRSQPHATSG